MGSSDILSTTVKDTSKRQVPASVTMNSVPNNVPAAAWRAALREAIARSNPVRTA